ncbi:MAG: acyl-CoA thioesterase [Pseudonocardiales bacterium]|nr:acyl-CoA thioesterase [Pseudonocardiales bacterium]MBV9029313.1 acyl-CoA thioesterase [Pseudonocardiales bacterium]MBW0011282.1 acyl-CoA thioesterase [Pseudonocardiales bacterium]
MRETFTVRIAVRGYEIDAMGHLNGGVLYYQYAEHARWELLRAAGVVLGGLLEHGVGPVNLETTMRFHNELRYENEVDVSCAFRWGVGKSFRAEQEFRRTDGILVAELSNVGGLMDLQARRLVVDPGAHFRELATNPGLLGL